MPVASSTLEARTTGVAVLVAQGEGEAVGRTVGSGDGTRLTVLINKVLPDSDADFRELPLPPAPEPEHHDTVCELQSER